MKRKYQLIPKSAVLRDMTPEEREVAGRLMMFHASVQMKQPRDIARAEVFRGGRKRGALGKKTIYIRQIFNESKRKASNNELWLAADRSIVGPIASVRHSNNFDRLLNEYRAELLTTV